jgi:hypothetical protein
MDYPDSVIQRFSMWMSCTCPGSWGKFNWNVFPPWQRWFILPALLPKLPKQHTRKEHPQPSQISRCGEPTMMSQQRLFWLVTLLRNSIQGLTPALTTAWLTVVGATFWPEDCFCLQLHLNLLGPNSSRLNWDEISEVFQRIPSPELKFCYGGNDSRYRLKKTSSYLEFH